MDYKDLAIELGFQPTSETQDYITCFPIWRDSDNPKGCLIDRRSGVVTDWADSVSMSFVSAVSKVLGICIKDAKEWVTKKGKGFDTYQKVEKAGKIDMPKKFSMDELGHTTASYKFYLNKGISQKTLEDFGCVFCHGGRMSNRATFPIWDNKGVLRGFSGRDVLNYPGTTRPKWKHLGQSRAFCYPGFLTQPHIISTEQVLLVESIGDALAAYDAGIKQVLVLFGLNMSKELLCYITSLNPKTIFLGLNNDETKEENRGKKAAEKVKNNLLKFFSPKTIETLILPKNDFGDMSKEEIIQFAQENGIKTL